MNQRTCTIDGCTKPARGSMCSMHRSRLQRHGDANVNLRDGSGRTLSSSGYYVVRRPGHPIAPPSGQVHEHRLVLWSMISGGAHPCHWCGRLVAWDGDRTTGRNLVVDHVDTVKTNNEPANLVPACHACNVNRTGIYKLAWTHCPNGHAYSPENLEAYRDCRSCITCRRERNRLYRERKRRERAG